MPQAGGSFGRLGGSVAFICPFFGVVLCKTRPKVTSFQCGLAITNPYPVASGAVSPMKEQISRSPEATPKPVTHAGRAVLKLRDDCCPAQVTSTTPPPRASGIENAQNKRDDDHTPTAYHPPTKGTDSHSADQIRPVKVSTCVTQHLVETPRHHMKNGFCWRRVPESNRSTRICNPLRNLSANPPQPVFLYGSRRAWSRVYHCVHHVPALCLIWRRAALPGLRCAM